MTTLESRCLDQFPAWLHALPDDARALAALLESSASEPAKRSAAAALTYLFKSLDLIPDGLEDLGYVDDAFVLRVAALQLGEAERADDASGTLARLADDAALIREFLGPSFAQLESYVQRLGSATAKGRSVADVLADPAVLHALAHDVREWASGYAVPSFTRDGRTLIKLRAFFETKLAGAAAS